ncbi:hypothetical protein EKO04_002005 [Ascochyta lentis]|uniref:Uncharacterized protein n=1 Tax=Ascochyta lentis TaxID=205686 RepID=A0A8H7JBW7_9PLEO|nr:hypothetical protein EKO04_002005 [Ascochyta lentis]
MLFVTTALGLLTSTALAAPAPGASMDTPFSARDLALLGADVLDLMKESIPGRQYAEIYGFGAILRQDCEMENPSTKYMLGPIVDGHYHVLQDGYDSPIVLSSRGPTHVDVLGTSLSVEVDRDIVSYEYGAQRWNSTQPFDSSLDLSCLTNGWSNALHCNDTDPGHRYLDTFCMIWDRSGNHDKYRVGNVNASIESVAPSTETRSPKNSSMQIPSYIFDTVSPEPVSPSTNEAAAPEFAHGMCSFYNPLLQECVHTPNDGWYTQTIGLLNYVWDNNSQPIVQYPKFAGRIDTHPKLLTKMGNGLSVRFGSDGYAYFRYEDCVWSSQMDDKDGCGRCVWGPWSDSALQCNEQTGVHYRASDMKCFFRC